MLKQILSVTLALSLIGVGSSAEDSFETCEIPAGEARNTEGDCKITGRMGKTALLLGATGETGRELLRELVHAPAFDKVVTVTRRLTELPKEEAYSKVEQRVVDFDKLSEHSAAFQNVDKASVAWAPQEGRLARRDSSGSTTTMSYRRLKS